MGAFAGLWHIITVLITTTVADYGTNEHTLLLPYPSSLFIVMNIFSYPVKSHSDIFLPPKPVRAGDCYFYWYISSIQMFEPIYMASHFRLKHSPQSIRPLRIFASSNRTIISGFTPALVSSMTTNYQWWRWCYTIIGFWDSPYTPTYVACTHIDRSMKKADNVLRETAYCISTVHVVTTAWYAEFTFLISHDGESY